MALISNYWTLASFSLAILVAPYLPWMPKSPTTFVTLLIGLVVIVVSSGRKGIGIILALMVIITYGYRLTAQSNNILQFGTDITINGYADSFFSANQYGFSGSFVVRSINGQKLSRFSSPKIRLSTPVALQPGDQGQFEVRVRPVFGRLNEVGFDREAYFMSQGWVAQASVKTNSRYQLNANANWRAIFYQQVAEQTQSSPVQAFILALTFGERQGITEQQWLGLRNSGLIHLMAISGLHIGMAFGVGYFLGAALSRLWPTAIWLPFIIGGSLAWVYAWLAGFTIPTQRALVMCWLNILLVLLHCHISAGQRVLLTLAAVLTLDPLASLSSSFWLSFFAVSVVMYQFAIIDNRLSLWKKLLLGHVLLVVLMAPVTAYFFAGVSLYSALYNLLFIPWFSFVVVPLLFITLAMQLVLSQWTPWLWMAVDKTLEPLVWSLRWAEYSWLPVSQILQWLLLGIFLLILLRPLLTYRLLLTLAMLVSASIITWQPKQYWQLDMLDVGHGLAILIERNGRYVLYDTGSSWQEGSFARSLIIPLLMKRGAMDRLDGVVISHSDNDHAGGLRDIQEVLQPTWVRASFAQPGFYPCIQAESWSWQGLSFQVLWPPRLVKRADNPHSCVVRVMDDEYGHSILLTGDVTAVGEWLLSRDAEPLQSDILIVPHHGSQTSSTQAFIENVNPQLAIASLAKGHRWRLPHPEVFARYQALDIPWLDTGEVGQITIRYDQYDRQIITQRQCTFTPWYRQMLRKEVE